MSPIRKFGHLSESKKITKMTKMKLRSSKQNCFCKITNNAAQKLALYKLMKEEDFVDLTVCSKDGTQMNIHGIVFGSLSDDIMEDASEENGERQLDFTADVLNILIQLVYYGTCNVTNDTVEALLQLANTYNIDLLKKVCGDFLLQNMSKESFLTYYSLGSDLCCHIKEEINKFAKANFRSLIKDGQIGPLNCDMEDLENWLDADDLNLGEDELFKFIMSMTSKVDQSKIPDLLQYVRFTILGSSHFNKNIINSDQFQSTFNTQTALNKRVKTAVKYYSNIQTPRPIRNSCKQTDKLRFASDLVLISGGWSTGGPINRIDIWDIRAEKWVLTNLALPFGVRAYHKMVCLDSDIYLVGGYEQNRIYHDTLYSLDLNTMAWTELSFMLTKRCYVSATTLGNKLVVVGGYDGRRRLKSAEIYDPNTNQWESLPDMAMRRSDAACVEFEGCIFAIGGFTGEALLNEIEIWNPSTAQWRLSSPMAIPRSGHSAVVLEGRIYVVGGFNGEERLKSVECFTPGPIVTWHQVQDMMIPRSNFAISVVEGKILVCGGYSDPSIIGKCEMYFPDTNNWSMMPDLPVGRSSLASVVVPEAPNIKRLLNRT